MNQCTANCREGYDLLQEGAVALARVAKNGIKVNGDELERAIRRTGRKIKDIEESLREDDVYLTWRKTYGTRANLGSREQLAHVLFDVMEIPSPGYTERSSEEEDGKKRYKTDKAALVEFVDLPFTEDYIRVEGLKKLLSTYLVGLQRETVGGFVHPVINLNTVRTFRSSASAINIQNQYKRNPEFKRIVRRCLVPREDDWVLAEVDLRTAEVRCGCCYHKDPNMVRYIEDESTDMHRDSAMKLFNLKKDQVDKATTRDWAKNRFVFPAFYGSVWFQCAPAIWKGVCDPNAKIPGTETTIREHLARQGITELGPCDPRGTPEKGTFEYQVKKALDYLWNTQFPRYRDWKDEWYDAYKRKGYFDLLTGFRESGLYSKNDSGNHPIQGSAFHWDLWDLITIQKELRRKKMRTLIVSEVHDCVILDGPLGEMPEALAICERVMTKDVRDYWKWIFVPVAIEIEVSAMGSEGGSWAKMEEWVQDKSGNWKPKAKKVA